MNSLSEHAALSKFMNINCIYAFPDELAKRTYRAKRVHLLRMNTHHPIEIPMAK